jgi:hypothetical protein
MKKLILNLLFVLATFNIASVFVSQQVLALDCANPQTLTPEQQTQCGACAAAGHTECDPGGSSESLTNTITKIINVISVFAGAAAVVMIIIGGFRYVTSGGNQESTKSARNTIVYAVIGLVIVALAQVIVHFVLNNVKPT